MEKISTYLRIWISMPITMVIFVFIWNGYWWCGWYPIWYPFLQRYRRRHQFHCSDWTHVRDQGHCRWSFEAFIVSLISGKYLRCNKSRLSKLISFHTQLYRTYNIFMISWLVKNTFNAYLLHVWTMFAKRKSWKWTKNLNNFYQSENHLSQTINNGILNA